MWMGPWCAWSATAFELVVHAKWRQYECQDPRFPSRVLLCSEMIMLCYVMLNGILSTCKWFQCSSCQYEGIHCIEYVCAFVY